MGIKWVFPRNHAKPCPPPPQKGDVCRGHTMVTQPVRLEDLMTTHVVTRSVTDGGICVEFEAAPIGGYSDTFLSV